MRPALAALLVIAAIGMIGVGVLGGCADDGGPKLSMVTPASARVGASVELGGDGFCGRAPNCVNVAAKVEIGLEPPVVVANILAYSASAATIQIPQIATVGTTELVLTVDGRSSNALDFEVLP